MRWPYTLQGGFTPNNNTFFFAGVRQTQRNRSNAADGQKTHGHPPYGPG